MKFFNMGIAELLKRVIFWDWEPKQDSLFHEFCSSSAIHGLKYMSRRKMKLTCFERIFWVVAFIASSIASWIMIRQVWERYHESPVIVTFTPMEEETAQLPFPAVTICNKGLFSARRIQEIFDEYDNATEKKMNVMEKLRLVNALCTSKRSFLRNMGLGKPESYEAAEGIEELPSDETLNGIVKFYYENTQPCNELIRVCSWDSRKEDCSKLFKPIVTDYGKCCVFNKMPSELMLFEIDQIGGSEKREQGNTYEEIDEWTKWNYEDGFIIADENLKFPRRQRRAGIRYGLSVLLDPNPDDGYCQQQDSYGIRILLHTPIDVPRITHLGTGFGMGREVFVKVLPDSTVADNRIAEYDYAQRKCLFGKGKTMGRNDNRTIDKPYTRNNCFLTCQQRHISVECNCTLHYARRKAGFSICNPSINSRDSRCVKRIMRKLASNLRRDCPTCIFGCNFLKFSMEATEATMMDENGVWGNDETAELPPWANRKVSILHIFMGVDVNVPKMRQKLYRNVDLIASIGGLLGITLGVSVLTFVEIVYFFTIRLFCNRYRNRHFSQRKNMIDVNSVEKISRQIFPYLK